MPDFPLVNVQDSCGDHPDLDPNIQAARIFGTAVVMASRIAERNDEVVGRILESIRLEAML